MTVRGLKTGVEPVDKPISCGAPGGVMIKRPIYDRSSFAYSFAWKLEPECNFRHDLLRITDQGVEINHPAVVVPGEIEWRQQVSEPFYQEPLVRPLRGKRSFRAGKAQRISQGDDTLRLVT